MGITFINATVRNPEKPKKEEEVEFLVGSGAIFSVVDSRILEKLDIKPNREQEFTLADGTKVKREVGNAIFKINGTIGASPVIFGKKGDSNLFGALTLEALALILDPFKRELRPMKLWMAKIIS